MYGCIYIYICIYIHIYIYIQISVCVFVFLFFCVRIFGCCDICAQVAISRRRSRMSRRKSFVSLSVVEGSSVIFDFLLLLDEVLNHWNCAFTFCFQASQRFQMTTLALD